MKRAADIPSRQQKAAATRIARRINRRRFVDGFMQGYLMGCFDTKHRIPRHVNKVLRLAELNAEEDGE